MPPYPPKKQTQTEIRYEISTAQNKYLLTIRSSPTSTLVYIGGAHFWCLECQIFPDTPAANLSKIEFNEGCSLSGRFERGKDVKTLMRLLMSYLRIEYPFVSSLQFNDYSYRNCTGAQTIDLAPFYYILYGKTWYMAHMDATFVEESEAVRFAEAAERFNLLKLRMTWKEFDAHVTSAHPLAVAEMESLFTTHETWQSYFTALLARVGIGRLCSYMAPWITTFVSKIGKLRFHSYDFTIPVLGGLEYITTHYSARGGRRYTRHQPKRRAMDLH
jgi:hypothetical protein